MPTIFRAYTLNLQNRIAGPPTVLDCESVDAALIAARALATDDAIELWHGAQRIAVFQPLLQSDNVGQVAPAPDSKEKTTDQLEAL